MKIKELSVLQKAIANTDSLKKHLDTYHIDAQEENKGYTLLHQAVDQWEKETQSDLKYSEIKQSPVNKTDQRKPKEDTIEPLIVQGASPYIKDKKGQRVIESKIFQDYIKQILNTHKPDPSKKTYFIYLAGPEVFLTFNRAAGQFIKAQTRLFNNYYLHSAPYNIEGLYPFDSRLYP